MSQPGKRILLKTIEAELELIRAMKTNTAAYSQNGDDDNARNASEAASAEAHEAIRRLRHLIDKGEPANIQNKPATPEHILETAKQWQEQAERILAGTN